MTNEEKDPEEEKQCMRRKLQGGNAINILQAMSKNVSTKQEQDAIKKEKEKHPDYKKQHLEIKNMTPN